MTKGGRCRRSFEHHREARGETNTIGAGLAMDERRRSHTPIEIVEAQHPLALRRTATFEWQERMLEAEPARGSFRQFRRAVRLLAAQVDDGAQPIASRRAFEPAGRGMIRAIEAAGNDLGPIIPEYAEVRVVAKQALEPEPALFGNQICRSRSRLLISPIALPGFSPFGQVMVQFMMVWQRYSLNGSCSASSRSPVNSSRESAIQR